MHWIDAAEIKRFYTDSSKRGVCSDSYSWKKHVENNKKGVECNPYAADRIECELDEYHQAFCMIYFHTS